MIISVKEGTKLGHDLVACLCASMAKNTVPEDMRSLFAESVTWKWVRLLTLESMCIHCFLHIRMTNKSFFVCPKSPMDQRARAVQRFCLKF